MYGNGVTRDKVSEVRMTQWRGQRSSLIVIGFLLKGALGLRTPGGYCGVWMKAETG